MIKTILSIMTLLVFMSCNSSTDIERYSISDVGTQYEWHKITEDDDPNDFIFPVEDLD